MLLTALPAAALGSIPSPSSGNLGPFHMYGLMIALGVLAAIELARSRWKAKGGNPDDIYAIALWAVPAGLIGARLYHVVTDWNRLYSNGRVGNAVKIWEGGLGIPGGIAAGVAVGVWVAHRRGIRLSTGLDAIIPGIPLAQAIGRLGNWWNQELFGRPTSLPWGVEIDPQHRPARYIDQATFHPTFLYELLWNLALVWVLVLLDRKKVLRPGNILPVYIGGYFLGRLWVEAMRSDEATLILGLRVNIWISILGIGGSIIALLVRGIRRRPDDSEEPYRDGHRWEDPASAEAFGGPLGAGSTSGPTDETDGADARDDDVDVDVAVDHDLVGDAPAADDVSAAPGEGPPGT